MRGALVGGGAAALLILALGCGGAKTTPAPAAEPAAPPPKTDVQDDRVDLAQLQDIVEDWHRGWKNGNKQLESQADARLKRWIKQELAEDRQQTQQADAEAHRSAGTHNAHAAVDDQKDANKAEREANKTRHLASQLRNIQPRFDDGTAAPPQYQKKSELLRELQQVAKRELERSKQEQAEDSRQGGGGNAQAESQTTPKPAASGGGGGGGGQKASGSDKPADEVIGPRKLVAAINSWVSGRQEKKPKQVKQADERIRSWWKQELARDKAWTPRSKQIALELKKTQPAFNKGEATQAQYKAKKALLVELKAIAKARIK